jgi:hypothetical protein
VHAHPAILLERRPDRIDPDLWRPLIMSFQHFYGLAQRLHPSKLASIDEERYRSPDTMRGREAADTPAFIDRRLRACFRRDVGKGQL